ncbi:MAG: DUF4384 domain-containing protein, partial [Treponema sp.]|nr:DUF4384 domain-containing protein [Treponema sp.]
RGVDVESGELRGTRTYSLKEDTVLASILNPRIKPPNITLKELTERQEILRPFEGEHNAFGLEVWPEAGKNVFYEGDRLIIKLRAGTDCYFVVYHVDVDSKIQVIYPNPTDAGTNVLRAGVIRTIPERSSFRLQAPYGEERILIYASDRPFNIPYEQYTPQTISRSLVQAQVRGVDNTPASPPSGGATNQFSYTILPRTK